MRKHQCGHIGSSGPGSDEDWDLADFVAMLWIVALAIFGATILFEVVA